MGLQMNAASSLDPKVGGRATVAPPRAATVVQRRAAQPGSPQRLGVAQRASTSAVPALPIFDVSYRKWPNIAAQTDNYLESSGEAQIVLRYMAEKPLSPEEYERFVRIGQAQVTTNRAKNRWNAMERGIYFGPKKKPGDDYELDEFPYASTYEGGVDATVSWVPKSENASHGATLRAFYQKNQFSDGAAFLVRVVD